MPPLYQWECPQCKQVSTTINRMSDSHIPPDKCSPESERTDQTGEDGKPIYKKHEPCGYIGTDVHEQADDGTVTRTGWRKLIGSTNFILKGGGWFRDRYS